MATVLTPAEIKQKIEDWITTNGNHEITGAHLNTILAAIMDYVGVGYALRGTAPASAPSPDVPSAYLAAPGTYTNYESGDTVIPEGSIAILKYDGSAWSKSVIKVCDPVSVSQKTLIIGGEEKCAVPDNWIDNNGLIEATTDKDGNILEGIQADGTKVVNIPIKTPSVKIDNTQNKDWLEVTIDKNGNVLEGISTDGKKKIFVEVEIGGVNIKDAIKGCSQKFASLGIEDLSILGTSTLSNGIINLNSGEDNRIQVGADLMSWYYKIICKVKFISGTPNVVIGKNGAYGTLFSISNNQLVISKNGVVETPITTGFVLTNGVEYTITLSHNATTTKIDTLEIYDTFGNYYTYSLEAHSYGNPVVYSESANCQISKWAMSMQYRYTPTKAKMIVTGHSYVEADSLGNDRTQCFTALLDNYNGENTIVNCGLGGDMISAMNSKMPYFIKMNPTVEYIFMVIGGNDRSASLDSLKTNMLSAIQIVKSAGKKPILCTINPAIDGFENEVFPNYNEWVRGLGYPYVDMEKVFYNPDGTINTSLYLQDGLHPTIEGHLRIYRRIQMDCPFLF